MPLAKQASRLRMVADAVMATIWISRLCTLESISAMSRVASKPLRLGICTSMKSHQKWDDSRERMASDCSTSFGMYAEVLKEG